MHKNDLLFETTEALKMKKRSSVIAWTLAAVLVLSNLSPAAVYAAGTEVANAATAATEEVSAEEEASTAEALAAQESEEEEASPAGSTDVVSDEISAPEEAAEETPEEAVEEAPEEAVEEVSEESTEKAAAEDEALADDEEVNADAAIEADPSAENTDSEDATTEENESEEETAEETTPDNPTGELVGTTPEEANQPTPEQPVVEPVDAMEIIYSDGITEGSGRDAKSAGSTNVDVDEILSLEVIPTDVDSATDGCILAGVPGKYVADAQAALDRINEIRREACEEGVLNPDTNMPLTMDDYVEIKWSNDLEYIARIRAAESAFTGAHSRANGEDCWGISSPSGVRSYGEVLAWNWSESVIDGINQWYGEKEDWVNQTQGAVTGHYTQMIDPTNTYVGLGTFCCDGVRYYNTTAGEFSGRSGLDETPMSMVGDCLQMIEFATSNLSGTSKIIGKMTGSKGETGNLLLATGTKCKFASTDVYLLDGVAWSSSNKSVVTISEDGMTEVVGGGTSTITASAAGGSVQASAEFSVKLIEDCDIAIAQSTYTYDGQEKKPAVTVTYNGAALTQGTDYTVSYANNTNAGTATVTITAVGEFQGEAERSFTIKKATQTVTAEPGMSDIGVGMVTGITADGIGTITYKSSDTSVATVDTNGQIKGVGDGDVTITVAASGDGNHESGQASFTMTVSSVFEVKSGSCGTKATWTYYHNGEVRIKGSGALELVQNASGDYLWDEFYAPDEAAGYKKVHTVYIEDGITAIPSGFFSVKSTGGSGKMSDSPRTVVIADSVKTIESSAFRNCTNLESVSIGAGLTTLGNDAFAECPSLGEITVSSQNSSFKTLNGALYNGDGSVLIKVPGAGRTELTIPKSVQRIEDAAFAGCSSITDINYEYSASRWTLVTIGENNEVLADAKMHYAVTETPMSSCKITLDQTSYTYDGNAKAPVVTVTCNGTELQEGFNFTVSHSNNVNAGTATVTVTGVVDYAGEATAEYTINKAAQTVTAQPRMKVLGVNLTTPITASGIGTITYESSNPSVLKVDDNGWMEGVADGTATVTVTAFGDENHESGSTSFEMTVVSVYEVESGSCGANATWTYYNNGEVRIHGTGTVELVQNASGDYLWDKYYTPDEVWGYEKVNTVYVEEGITAIGSEVFSVRSSNGIGKMSDSPRTVELADSVKTIYKMAFFNCPNLESVSIGAGLTSIGPDAFTYCPSLKEIKVSSENNSFKTQEGVLYSKDGSVLVKVPNDGRTELTIPDGVATLEIGAISDLNALKTLTIPKSVVAIREYALDGSDGITDIYYRYSPSRWNLISIGGYNDVLETANMHFEVADTPISKCEITLDQTAFTYDGKAKQPKVTVTCDGTALEEGFNYTVSCTNNVNAGTATVTVKGAVDYEGETTANFTIGKANQTFGASAAAAAICVGKTTTVRTSGAKGTVTWSSANPAIATVSGTTLKALKAGIVKLTATASGDTNYNPATATITVAVLPGATSKITTTNLSKGIKVSWAKVAGANGYFIYRNGTLVKTINSGSTVSFSDTGANTNGKKYVYKVVARATSGKSTLSKSLTTYRVSRPAIKSLRNGASRKMTVKWGKNSKASGYIVQYGLKSSFKGAKTVTLSKATLISKTIAKLTKGKVYYVRVRAFKKVSSKKYYSAWSAAKKVKISK